LVALFADGADEQWVIGAARPRAVRALLAHAGVNLPTRCGWVELPYEREALKSAVGKPWHPVIDRDRCVACGQCADYCLFGVYDRDASGAVRVARPSACKPGCPACARLCPVKAVIFPFCPEEPINGAPVADVVASPLSGLAVDPMAALRARRGRP